MPSKITQGGRKIDVRVRYFQSKSKYSAQELISMFLLLGISAVSQAQPKEVLASNVQNCQYVDRVEGSSGYGKNSGWQDLAKYSALMQAEKLGASHVVWEGFTPIGAFNGIAIAKAYNCNS